MHRKDLCQILARRILHPNSLMCQNFQKVQLYIIFPLENKLFHPKVVQNVVGAIKIRMIFCFSVANNVEHVEDILVMYNVYGMLTEVARYNARIRCHYIA